MIPTREPSGLPSWPLVLLAGAEGSGKSWAAAVASGSALIGTTYWIGMGEQDPDEYGSIPGARFKIVIHDGTVRNIKQLIRDITAEPRGDKPSLIVVDSGTKLWGRVSEDAQEDANRRAKREDATIGVDLWNKHKGHWRDIIDALRAHDGPAVITARYGEVAEIVKGKPTGEKFWKVQAEKDLPYDVDALVVMPERGKAILSKVRSVRLQLERPMEMPKFTVDELWRRIGLDQGQIGRSAYSAPAAEPTESEDTSGVKWMDELAKAETLEEIGKLGSRAIEAKASPEIVAVIRLKHRATAELSTRTPLPA